MVGSHSVNIKCNNYAGYIKQVEPFIFFKPQKINNNIFLILFVVVNINDTVPELIPIKVSNCSLNSLLLY